MYVCDNMLTRISIYRISINYLVTTCQRPYTARYKSSCYKFVLKPADWMKAHIDCRLDGAHLVSLETMDENNHIRDYIKSAPFLARVTSKSSTLVNIVKNN